MTIDSVVLDDERPASSHHSTVSTKRSVIPKDQIRTTNLFYDRSVDGPGTFRRRNGKEKLAWEVKGSSDEKKDHKSFVITPTAKKNNNAYEEQVQVRIPWSAFKCQRHAVQPLTSSEDLVSIGRCWGDDCWVIDQHLPKLKRGAGCYAIRK
ncbi:hypothetical protein L6452_38638 [Arctium lappa]|uniref:Uncharacterized protein n=1 Tax=Arctium lappa TaxID=4217 RepID=A0ACB8XR98_ARCLA|nr:hypothetical protein L6452_38638 [Arctium lappa]